MNACNICRDTYATTLRYNYDTRTTVVRLSRRSHECRLILFIAILSRNRLNYVAVCSQNILIHIANLSHCGLRKLSCDGFARGSRRVGDGFATHAMTSRWFCDDFCRTKKYYMFKTLANRSRRVRDACEAFAIPCDSFATVRDGFANRFANPSRTRRIPVR